MQLTMNYNSWNKQVWSINWTFCETFYPSKTLARKTVGTKTVPGQTSRIYIYNEHENVLGRRVCLFNFFFPQYYTKTHHLGGAELDALFHSYKKISIDFCAHRGSNLFLLDGEIPFLPVSNHAVTGWVQDARTYLFRSFSHR